MSGPGIFSDDLAHDLRGHWRDLIAEGLSPREATDRLVAEYSETWVDFGEEPTFWIALAVSQWKTGRLLDDVRDRALEAIDTGADLKRWEGSPRQNARARVLIKARAQLASPQPEARAIRRREMASTPYVTGDVIAYQHAGGKWFVLWVSSQATDGSGTHNVVELLDFVGDEPPPLRRVVKRPAMLRYWKPTEDGEQNPPVPTGFLLAFPNQLKQDRVQVLGNRAWPTTRPRNTQFFIHAKNLDAEIEEVVQSNRWS